MLFDNKLKQLVTAAALGATLSGCDNAITPGDLTQPLTQTVGRDVTLKGFIKYSAESEDLSSPADHTRTKWRKVFISDSPNFDVPTVEAYIPELQHPSLGSVLACVNDGDYIELNGAVRSLGEGQIIFFERVDIQQTRK